MILTVARQLIETTYSHNAACMVLVWEHMSHRPNSFNKDPISSLYNAVLSSFEPGSCKSRILAQQVLELACRRNLKALLKDIARIGACPSQNLWKEPEQKHATCHTGGSYSRLPCTPVAPEYINIGLLRSPVS